MHRWPIPFLAVAALLAACARSPDVIPAAPAPAPRPESARVERARPEPRRAPVEHRFGLCALEPGTVRGLRTIEAVHVEGAADTLALVAGRRVPLAEAIGPVRVAPHTRWYAEHHTLDVPLGSGVVHYAIYEGGRVIEPGDLAYLGNVDGLPVYAAAGDVAPVRTLLTQLLAHHHDLPLMLATSPALRARFAAIDVLYVPLRPAGCVFQALVRGAER